MKVHLEVRDQFFDLLFKQIFSLIENKRVINELKMLKKRNPNSYVPLSILGSVQGVSSRRRDLETQVISFLDDEIICFNCTFPVWDNSSVLYIQIKIEESNYTKNIKVEGDRISIGKGTGLIEGGNIKECLLSQVLLYEIVELANQYLDTNRR